MRTLLWVAFFVVGCAGQTATGAKQTQETQNAQGSGTNEAQGDKVGQAGAICRCGQRATEDGAASDCKAVPCAEGLVCGYRCGIPGCDSTCMTSEEAESAMTVPRSPGPR